MTLLNILFKTVSPMKSLISSLVYFASMSALLLTRKEFMSFKRDLSVMNRCKSRREYFSWVNMAKVCLISIVLSSVPANAEMFVCHDEKGVITERHEGDCMALGICSDFNNQGMRQDCFEATAEEYQKASSRFTIYDATILDGSRVVDMKQEDIDAIIVAEKVAQDTATKEAQKAVFDTDEWQVALKILLQEAKSTKTVEEVTQEIKDEIDGKTEESAPLPVAMALIPAAGILLVRKFLV